MFLRDIISGGSYWLLSVLPGYYGRAFSSFSKKKKLYYRAKRKDLFALQRRRLINLLQIHSKNGIYSPLIKKIGIPRDENFDIYYYISQFPLLTKEFVQDNAESLLTPGGAGVYMNSSGGSTGVPLNFWQDYNYSVESLATTFLSDSIQKWYPGCREARLWGAPKDLSKIEGPRGRFFLFLKNQLWLDSFNMGEARMAEYHKMLSAFRPRVLIAYASSAFVFARFLKESSIKPDYGLEAIITSAEMLYPHMRETIEEVFGVAVFNRYGSREVGNIASECEKHGGLHLHMYDHIIEILPAANSRHQFGCEGEITVTCLNNFSMPFIRYKIGDLGVITNDYCSCGSETIMLKKITGRSSDSIITREGRVIHGEYFTHIFYGMKGVRQFQFVQRDYQNYEARLAVSGDYDKNSERDIKKECRQVLGADINLEIIYLQNIEPSQASGKYRFTISMLGTE